MARISICDIPAQGKLPERPILKKEIRLIDADDISLLIDPETGNWLGIRDIERPFIKILKNGSDLESLRQRYGDIIISIVEQMHLKGFFTDAKHDSPSLLAVQPSFQRKVRFTVTLTSACNLGCTYCSADADIGGSTMTEKILYQTLDSIFACHGQDEYYIHFGRGETLLVFDLFRKAVSYGSRKMPDKVKFSVQTNGTLLDWDKIAWLRDNNIHVGLSIDGPASVQDAQRPFSDGRPTFDVIQKNMRLMQKAGLRFRPLATVTSPEQFEQLFDFMLEHNLRGILVRAASCSGRYRSPLPPSSQKELASAHLALFDRILFHYKKTGIKLHEERIYRILKTVHSDFLNQSTIPCGAACGTVSIFHDGSIYPCDVFSANRELCMGNVSEGLPVMEIVSKSKVSKIVTGRSYKDIKKCRGCTYKTMCKGGRTCGSYNSYGSFDRESEQCVHNRTIIEGILIRAAKHPDLIKSYLDKPVDI